jgi:hypothetical protein
MPSQPLSKGSDFSPVFGLIDSDHLDNGPKILQPAHARPLDTALKDDGVQLGDFAKMFSSLGFSDSAPLPQLDPESELSNSDDALLPSPTYEFVQAPPVKHVEDTWDQPKTKTQRKKARRREQKELEEEQNRLRVIQETMDQIADEHKQMDYLEQRLSLRKKLEGLEVATATETPCKPSRAHSRSNVGAKVRPTTPTPVVAIPAPEPPRTQQKKPKTSKRPSILKRPSAPQPTTPAQQAPVIVPSTERTPKRPSILKRPTAPQPITPVQQAPAVVPSTEPVPLHAQYMYSGLSAAPQYFLGPRYVPVTPVGQHGLVPRTVRPNTLPRTASQPAATAQAPTTPTPYAGMPGTGRPTFTIRRRFERHLNLHSKLWNAFPEDRKYMVDPEQLLGDRSSAEGLHVFVDASNIMIGLKDKLRSYGFHHNAFDLSFAALALIMERHRPIAKKFSAGSHREANPLPHVSKLVETSKAVGYDTVMQEQVLIVREDSEKKKFFSDVKKMGWHRATQLRSGSGSDSETGPTPTPKTSLAPKWVEQGVDEILHLKMCQSIIDTEVPSTMVLATGDGAVAEMSDGFLAHVERALKRGWKVELVSWGQQLNGGYKNRKFRAKWADQFTIIELDDFLEDLIDTPKDLFDTSVDMV